MKGRYIIMNKKLVKVLVGSLSLVTFGLGLDSSATAKAAVDFTGWSTPLSQCKVATPTYDYSFPNTHITYYIKSSSKTYRSIWEKAASGWNKNGELHLTQVSNPHQAQMLLTTRADSPDGHGKYAGLTGSIKSGSETVLYSESQIYRNVLNRHGYTYQDKISVGEHEIGHALGLAVSPYKGSIEYLYTVDQHISAPDWNAISKLYKNKPAKVNVHGGFYNNNVSDSQFKF